MTVVWNANLFWPIWFNQAHHVDLKLHNWEPSLGTQRNRTKPNPRDIWEVLSRITWKKMMEKKWWKKSRIRSWCFFLLLWSYVSMKFMIFGIPIEWLDVVKNRPQEFLTFFTQSSFFFTFFSGPNLPVVQLALALLVLWNRSAKTLKRSQSRTAISRPPT